MPKAPMSTPLRSSTIPLGSRRTGYRGLWLASASWVVASIAGAAVVMANVPAGQWSPDLSSPAAVSSPNRAPDIEVRTSRFKSSCKTCGVIESIRKLEAAASTPARYEFTVRLRDGSKRVSSGASVAKWSVGDSIMLLGGDKPSSPIPVSL